MEMPLDVVMDFLAGLLWPLARISSTLASMTLLSSQNLSMRVRMGLAVAITVAVQPILPPMPDVDMFSLGGMIITMQEMLIGFSVGIASQLLIASFVLAGQIIGMQTSLGFANMVDPINGQQVPAVGQFYLLLASLVFLSFDGHIALIYMVVQSFNSLPVGLTSMSEVNYSAMVEWGGWMYTMALSMSLSAVVALLLINFSFGVMTRAAPQLNIFAIGFPITMLSGLLIIWLTVGNFVEHFERQWIRHIDLVCDLLLMSC
ncbi:flagellar biosynthetic protein FliR [Echinimonas agarilytica]|uniref:Flagellar biosynthetic protein FliR n=1 Tax=Echinimonas agarilytica TaxID=1215918 RepID=A0AA41W4U3_9GAMM|nr:flagellar biosynthetic protein FliR [Echinimonas agarilytica]MCM2678979.1 flagellar type III secretion system protein FliR [Echinimonas agarilytica]